MISKKIIRTIIVIVVVFVLIAVLTVGFNFGYKYILSQDLRMEELREQFVQQNGNVGVAPDTRGAIEIIIPRAADAKKIAEILEQKGMIKNTFMFTILSKFNGFDGQYMAGTHFILPDLKYDEIMYLLCQKPHSVRVTFAEGLTYGEMKDRLSEAGVQFDEQILDNLVRNPQTFLDYEFVTEITKNEGRDWMLEGYLFPDTYEFDINTDEETIIRTFLDNTANKLTEEYAQRARHIGKTMDEIIILASIVQMECQQIEEMRTVSGVFYNRLRKDMSLSSCATVNYLRKEHGDEAKLWLSNNDIDEYDSFYNTYIHNGLPPGPISAPGEFAIRAALWPEDHGYYFFSAKGDGTNVFAATFDQQERNIAHYQALAEQEKNEE